MTDLFDAAPLYAKVAVPAPLWPFDTTFDYRIPVELKDKIKPGCLVEVPLGRRKSTGVVFGVSDRSEVPPEKVKAILTLKLEAPLFDAGRLQLLHWLAKYYIYPIGEVCDTAIPSPVRDGTARTLTLKEGKVKALPPPTAAHHLNIEQQAAFDAFARQSSGTHLLWGITGSDKTEIYLRLIEEVLKRGQGALVLVPEIALTPQLTNRFEERFPGEVAIFHSGLRPKELRGAWLETLNRKKRIAIGARSSIFAPVQDLGMIVVDEEHDASYKQDDRLRYNAKDAAIALGAILQIPVVLGSATPSAETLHGVSEGRIGVAKLGRRAVGDAQLPKLTIVDLKKDIGIQNKNPAHLALSAKGDGIDIPRIQGDFFLSQELRAELEICLAQKKQSILFLNRRGLGSQELCSSCGHTMDCPNCDVKLTPHFKSLLCHYCAYEIESPKQCPSCGAKDRPFVRIGVGTEAVEQALALHFPRARVLRLDRDTVDGADDLNAVVGKFRDQEADILIGTQMVAKGHDFPQVTLVGILLAEMGLAVPDFRAFERNLQLLLQVSGRAGRGANEGKVLLQTFQPDHPVFEALQKMETLADYERFIGEEIRKRKVLGYPPEGSLCSLRFDGLDESLVERASLAVGEGLRKIGSTRVKILGPVVCPLRKVRNRYRWHILLKGRKQADLFKAVSWIFKGWQENKLEQKYKTRLLIDVDPQQML